MNESHPLIQLADLQIDLSNDLHCFTNSNGVVHPRDGGPIKVVHLVLVPPTKVSLKITRQVCTD